LDAAVKGIRAAGGIAIGRCMDIGHARQAEALVKLSLRRFGKLDVLVNNAGVLGPRVPLADYPVAEWNEVIRINLSGVFNMTRVAAKAMTGRREGCIINLTSTVGRQGRAGWGAYAVSKFGVEGLTQVFAQ
jgi:NAD(P)-dependent dehydrogenase (short-subunit alcohol dehydrogenase family)